MLRLLSILLLLPILIGADSWDTNPFQHGEDQCNALSFSPKSCYLNATVTGASDILVVDRCENFDVVYNSDTLTSDHDTTSIIYSCVEKAADTNKCEPINNNNLDGDPAVGGFEILGAAASWIFVQTTLSAGDTPRVIVTCHPRI